jgi:cell division protein ZapA (FtsZ GTPase activity inhibitor)
MPRMTTLNVTHDNIEHHAKTAKTDQKHQPETETARRTQAENQNFTHKKFFPDSY